MKDSTRKDLRDGMTALVTLVVISTILVMVSTGCAAVAHDSHGHAVKSAPKAMAKVWKPGRRCRTLGTEHSKRVAVMVQKDCIKNGVTTVAIVVLDNSNKGKDAAKDAVFMVKRILGFDPVLKAVVVGKDKGKVFMLTVVTGASSATVANR